MQALSCHSLCVEPPDWSWQSVTMPNIDKNAGPNHLRAWRERKGLTQAALAAEVGTNANMIQYLETGERALSAKWLRRLAPALDTTPGMLLDHDPNDLDTAILETWAQIDIGDREVAGRILKGFVKTGTDDG